MNRTTTCPDCRRSLAAARDRQVARELHTLESGRFILAVWDGERAQWTSSDLRASVERAQFSGGSHYSYSYGRTLESLPPIGIRTYATRAAALRSLPAPEAADHLCARHAREQADVLDAIEQAERARRDEETDRLYEQGEQARREAFERGEID